MTLYTLYHPYKHVKILPFELQKLSQHVFVQVHLNVYAYLPIGRTIPWQFKHLDFVFVDSYLLIHLTRALPLNVHNLHQWLRPIKPNCFFIIERRIRCVPLSAASTYINLGEVDLVSLNSGKEVQQVSIKSHNHSHLQAHQWALNHQRQQLQLQQENWKRSHSNQNVFARHYEIWSSRPIVLTQRWRFLWWLCVNMNSSQLFLK